MAKIDGKEKKIRKVFGMSYIQYLHMGRQFQKSVEALNSE